MATVTNLGKVSIVPRGQYAAATPYTRLDLVTDNGSAYLAVADSTGASLSDTTKWMKIVDSEFATSFIAPDFVAATAYPAGKFVINDGNLYVLPNGHEANVTWANTTKTQVTVGDELASLKSAITLQEETIPDTTQTIAFDASGNVSSITHKDGSNNTVRTDAFTFSGNTITEVRTLSTGESLTIVTNTDTLVTIVTYAAA